MNNMIYLVATIFIATVILVLAYTWLFAWFYCKPKKSKTTKTPLDYALPAEKVEFYSQGKRIEGWIISKRFPVETESFVIIAHGWSTNLSVMLPLAKFLYKAGFNMLLYDCRGHGNSDKDGPITLRKMGQDVSSALNFTHEKYKMKNLQVTVVGHCMGASAAIVAASYNKRIGKIIACSAFSDPKILTTRYLTKKKIPMGILVHLVYYFIERWLGSKMEDVSPLYRIKHITPDILLLHGAKDQIIPYSDSVLLKNTHPSNINFFKIEKCDHFNILKDFTFMNKTIDFINGKNGLLNVSRQTDEPKPENELYYQQASQKG